MTGRAKFILDAQDRTQQAVRSAQRGFARLDRSISTVVGTAATLGAGVGVIAFANNIVEASEKVTLLQARLDALGASATAFGEIARISREAGVAIGDTADIFTRFQIGAKGVGATTGDVAQLTENLIRLGQIGGATTQQLTAGLIQLSQGFASNRLGGEELRSVFENLPLVAQEIEAALGLAAGSLREFSRQGNLTADSILKINERTDAIQERWEQLPFTFQRARETLETEWTLTMAALDKALETSNTYRFFTETLSSSLRGLRALLGDFSDPAIASGENNRLLAEELEIRGRIAALEERRQGANSRRAENALTRQIANLKRQADDLRAQRAALQEAQRERLISESAEVDRVVPPATSTDTETAEEVATSKVPSREERVQLWLDILAVDAEAYQEQQQISEEADKAQAQAAKQAAAERVAAEKEAARQMAFFAEAAAADIQNAFADFFYDFDGNVKDMARNFIDAIRRMIAQMLAFKLLSGLGGFFGGFFGIEGKAVGGSVLGGTPYVVGEKGPEIFVPRESGTIIPNGAGGAEVTVIQNIDARGNDNPRELLALMPMLADAIERDIRDKMQRNLL